MAAVNRCQGFYRLRIYHLTTGAICAPPTGLQIVCLWRLRGETTCRLATNDAQNLGDFNNPIVFMT